MHYYTWEKVQDVSDVSMNYHAGKIHAHLFFCLLLTMCVLLCTQSQIDYLGKSLVYHLVTMQENMTVLTYCMRGSDEMEM